MLVLSGLFFFLCYLTWLFSYSFWLFLLGIAFRTLGGTLVSGTLEAYIYDFLKIHGKEDEFEKIWGRGTALNAIGIAIALAIGGIASQYSYELVLVFSALSPLVIVVVTLLLPDIKSDAPAGGKGYLAYFIGGIRRAFSSKVLVRILIYSAIVYAALGMLDEYDQVLMSSWLGLPNSFIGIWLATCVAISSIGAFFAHKVKNMGWKVLNPIAVATGILLIIVTFFRSPFLLGILVLMYVFALLISVIVQGMIQREIATDERATITSVNAVVTEAGATVLGLAFGFIANQYGIQVGYGFFGVVILVYMSGQLIIGRIKSRNVK